MLLIATLALIWNLRGRSKRPPTRAALIIPNALTAFAFEHVGDVPGAGVHYGSDQFQFFTTEMAPLGRGAWDFCNLLGCK
jgi:hypothetical protein